MNPNQNPTPYQDPNQPQPDVNAGPAPEQPVVAPAPEQPQPQQPTYTQAPQQPQQQPAQPQAPQAPYAPQAPQAQAPQQGQTAATANENPDKSYLVALVLTYFLGNFGAERFYLGKTGTAIAKLLTFGGFGIWTIVDALLVAFGKLHAKDDDRQLEGFAHNSHWVKILAIVIIVFQFIFGIILFLVIILGAIGASKSQSRVEQYNTSTQNQSLTQESDTSSLDYQSN